MRWKRPQVPTVLAARAGELTQQLAAAWQRRFPRGPKPDPVLHHPDVLAALLEMTGGMCAYCERPLLAHGPDAAVVAHHRPSWGAVGVEGDVDPRAYIWLTYEWENLYAACADCVRSRGTRFPVLGARATPRTELARERPLLLDPAADDLDAHLRYEDDGHVHALTERGRTTIDLLALNRDFLVRARLAVVELQLVSPDGSFPTLRRQLGAHPQALDGRSAAVPPPAPTAGPALPPAGGVAGQPAYDLTAPMADAQREQYYQATQWVERVVIRNFRPIRELEIDLSASTSDRGPWTVLLGENGSGKSSILHAIALTMMGGDQRRMLGIDARSYLRHGARKGLVQVYLSGRTEPMELTWEHGDTSFTGPEQVPALLLGYGATRLLPRTPLPTIEGRAVRVDNLFDALRPLTDPTSWLLSLDDDTFDEVAMGIGEVLALPGDARLQRDEDQVVLRQGRARSDLATLSDGYQSMVVMACDILRSVLRMWDNPALAEGIVLIDEIGAHLHPRWRMRIVTAARHLLPRVQFIVSTHDPLCLRGVVDGEVVVVRRNSEGDVVALTDLPPVTGMRIDQLLTSEHFGLGSTDDPEVAELWDEYYRLKALPAADAEQSARLDQVRQRLGELEQFGTTERERLLLTSAADYIAHRRETGDVVAPTNAEVTAKMARLWGEHLPGGG
jgi:uncharacterized protein (TIGR02646 family)